MAFKKDKKLDLLRRHPFFSACSQRELSRIGSLADGIDVDVGAVLTKEGTPGREFFVVSSGKAKVTIRGRKVATLGPGEFFGEMALVSPEPRSATVTAETPMKLYVVEGRAFWSLIDEVPSVARKVLRGLADRLRAVQKSPTY